MERHSKQGRKKTWSKEKKSVTKLVLQPCPGGPGVHRFSRTYLVVFRSPLGSIDSLGQVRIAEAAEATGEDTLMAESAEAAPAGLPRSTSQGEAVEFAAEAAVERSADQSKSDQEFC